MRKTPKKHRKYLGQAMFCPAIPANTLFQRHGKFANPNLQVVQTPLTRTNFKPQTGLRPDFGTQELDCAELINHLPSCQSRRETVRLPAE